MLTGTPALADPALGVGFTFAFGSGQVDYGVGVRAFSDNREDEFAASAGIDYMFNSQSWRGSLGAAYMMDNSYVGIDGGYNFSSGSFDLGIGGGWADTTGSAAPAVSKTLEKEPIERIEKEPIERIEKEPQQQEPVFLSPPVLG